MPNLSSMNGSAMDLVTTQEIIEGKLLADSMLEDLLSNLHDVRKTSQGLQAMLYVVVETPGIYKMMSVFFKKIKRSSSYLSTCSAFQKRMLLFSIVECLFCGQNLELRFTSERLTPLETILLRLGDVWAACEKDVDEDELRKMYIQTVKQAIIMFLKNNQSVEASKILVVNRHRLAEEYQEILQDLINHCSESRDILDELEQMPEHDYATYCAVMADFLEGLNANLEESMLRKFSSRMNSGGSDDPEEDPSGDNSEPDEPVEVAVEHSPLRSSSPALSSGIVSDAEQISEPEVVGAAVEQQHIGDTCSELDPSKDGKKDDLNSISPKICLSYRLKQQNRRSGIIIPCKYIVEHCRDINDEKEDKENEGFSRFSDNRMKQNTSTPVRSSASGKAGYRPHVHRNYLLGERFEDLNVSMQSSDGRSYSTRKKVNFTLELDSYIVAGCRRFGVGRWSQIRSSFPFPDNCTNVKIKDRFRTLIKLNYIAILDDGDFNVMNSNLKAELAKAMEKMRKKGSMTLSVNKKPRSSADRDSVKKNVPSSIGTGGISAPSHVTAGKDIDVVSMSSEDSQDAMSTSKPKFTPTEDAYLLCGARYLGLRWNILKEYLDFQSNITASHMQERWDELIAQGKIEADDDGSEIYCHDISLENRSLGVTNSLKEKIQKERKSTSANVMRNDEGTNSENSPSSVVSPIRNLKQGRKQQRIVDSFTSDNDLDEPQEEMEEDRESFFKMPEPVAPTRHNSSVDAGTQTKKQRVNLRHQSPSLLDCESSMSESEPERHVNDKSKFEVGTPIRPSAINFFKRERQGKKRKMERSNSFASEVRERRQRELSRKQRKKAPTKKIAWSDAETQSVIDGLKKYGPGKWSQILDDGYDLLKDRTSVMVKDRYRTLLKQGLITEEMLGEWKAERASKTKE